MMPGMIVLPATSIRLAPAGMDTAPARPIAVMRLPSTTTVPFSMTPAVAAFLPPAPRRRHRDDPRADERDRAVRHVRLRVEPDLHALDLGLVGLLQVAIEEGEGPREIALEELRAKRPEDRAAVARPVQVVAGVARDLRRRIAAHAGSKFDRTSGMRKRRNVGVEPLFERDPLAIRRRHDLHRVLGLEVDDLVARRQPGGVDRQVRR